MTGRRSRARLRARNLGVVLLVVNVLVFAAVTWPRITRVRRAESRAAQVSARRASLEKLWSQVVTRKELVAQNRLDMESLHRDHLRSRSKDLFAAQREIEKLAEDSGLRPKRSSYSLQKIRGTDLVRCEVTLPLDGSYVSLTGFLSRIEAAKRFIVVDQMALSEEEDRGARMNLKLSAIFKDGETDASP